MFILIILIIVLIILARKNIDLTNENKELKNKSFNFCPRCGYALSKISGYNQLLEDKVDLSKNTSSIKTKDDNTSPEYNKNNLILITGSILIILSSIIFLTTTWDVINNIFKITVIFLMLVVFLVASYLAKDKLNLPNTSRAFFYIGLSYIPIALAGISLFSLFGKYLSFYGTGKYLYLSLSSLLTGIIYYLISIKNKGQILNYFGTVFITLFLMFIGTHLKLNSNITISLILVYSTILIMFYLRKRYFYNKQVNKNTINAIMIFSVVIYFIFKSLFA